VTTPEVRGTAFAVFTLTDDLGKGLGPLMIVALIDAFGHNRKSAFNLDVFGWSLCSLFLAAAAFFYEGDFLAAQRRVEKGMRVGEGEGEGDGEGGKNDDDEEKEDRGMKNNDGEDGFVDGGNREEMAMGSETHKGDESLKRALLPGAKSY